MGKRRLSGRTSGALLGIGAKSGWRAGKPTLDVSRQIASRRKQEGFAGQVEKIAGTVDPFPGLEPADGPVNRSSRHDRSQSLLARMRGPARGDDGEMSVGVSGAGGYAERSGGDF